MQVYAHAAEDADETPHAHLAAFKRVLAPAGAEIEVELTLPETAWTVVREDGTRERAKGPHTFYVGTQQPDPRSAALTGLETVKIIVNM